MQNKISINEGFIKRIISSKLKDEVAIKKEELGLPSFVNFILPELIIKLDKENIVVGDDIIEIPANGILNLKLRLKNFQVLNNNLEFHYAVILKFLGEHRIDKIINFFFKEIDEDMFHKQKDKIIVKAAKLFSENELDMNLLSVVVNNGIEITWE